MTLKEIKLKRRYERVKFIHASSILTDDYLTVGTDEGRIDYFKELLLGNKDIETDYRVLQLLAPECVEIIKERNWRLILDDGPKRNIVISYTDFDYDNFLKFYAKIVDDKFVWNTKRETRKYLIEETMCKQNALFLVDDKVIWQCPSDFSDVFKKVYTVH